MFKRIIQACLLLIGGTLGVFWGGELFTLINLGNITLINNPYVSAFLGAFIFYLLTFWTIGYLTNFMRWLEELLIKAPIVDILFGSLGLIFGLIIAFLIGSALKPVQVPIINTIAPILLTLLFGYLGFQVGLKKRYELVNLFSKGKKKVGNPEPEKLEPIKAYKILDTSVIIDGRIADICKTGFLEGAFVIPRFVLEELQHIADSEDVLKRNRGRRGLDILNQIQKELAIQLDIYEGNFEEIPQVDSKLVKLAKLTNGVLLTTDFNLTKVCELQNVSVLNINDLVNALKPVVLSGEKLNVEVLKEGKEDKQGIAYLDDGTMIVVEDGQNYIGKRIDILITSMLQTSSGRLIFAKPNLNEKARL